MTLDFRSFPIGSRVRLVRWQPACVDDHEFVPKGTEGTVVGHSGTGRCSQLWVRWDNGATLSPVDGDIVEVIS
jgi:hypothetical protein